MSAARSSTKPFFDDAHFPADSFFSIPSTLPSVLFYALHRPQSTNGLGTDFTGSLLSRWRQCQHKTNSQGRIFFHQAGGDKVTGIRPVNEVFRGFKECSTGKWCPLGHCIPHIQNCGQTVTLERYARQEEHRDGESHDPTICMEWGGGSPPVHCIRCIYAPSSIRPAAMFI